jgi:hypothetical protein
MEESILVTFHPDEKSTYTYRIPDVVQMTDSMSKDLSEQSVKFLWFDSLCSRLTAKRDHISNHLKHLLANTELSYRRASEGEKTTEAKIKAQVDSDPEVLKVKGFLQDAEAELNMCYSIRNAFIQRKDMLVTLGANLRAELNSFNPDNIKG